MTKTVTFALISGTDVFHAWQIEDAPENPGMSALLAGVRSNPVMVETEHQDIGLGWKYIDGVFYAPQNIEPDLGPGYELEDD